MPVRSGATRREGSVPYPVANLSTALERLRAVRGDGDGTVVTTPPPSTFPRQTGCCAVAALPSLAVRWAKAESVPDGVYVTLLSEWSAAIHESDWRWRREPWLA